jgi:hypothetical protein
VIIKEYVNLTLKIRDFLNKQINAKSRADVPGWVLVVLMTTILRNSLDAMGGIR